MASNETKQRESAHRPRHRARRRVLVALLISLGLKGCDRPVDPLADIVDATALCASALTGGGREAIEEAGWVLEDRTAGTARFNKGALALSLLDGGGRCFVDGQVDTLGGLTKVRDALAVQFGPAVQETRGTFRWATGQGGLLVKLSQTYVQDREVLRLFVFRPGVRLAPGRLPRTAP